MNLWGEKNIRNSCILSYLNIDHCNASERASPIKLGNKKNQKLAALLLIKLHSLVFTKMSWKLISAWKPAHECL